LTKEQLPALSRPENTSVSKYSQDEPWRHDPELAQIEIARIMIQKMGRPSRVNKEFIARKALFKALNHRDRVIDQKKVDFVRIMLESEGFKGLPKDFDSVQSALDSADDTIRGKYRQTLDDAIIDPGNPTGLDFSLWIDFYEKYEEGSINEDGVYFNNFWTFLNKPRLNIMQGGVGIPMFQEEEKQSIVGRMVNWFRGGKKNDTTNNQ